MAVTGPLIAPPVSAWGNRGSTFTIHSQNTFSSVELSTLHQDQRLHAFTVHRRDRLARFSSSGIGIEFEFNLRSVSC